jgi:hypothetical protein
MRHGGYVSPVHTSIVDTFNGLPLHVLVVHAAVIVTPVAALAALALVRPSWRTRFRWPVALAVGAAWLLVWLARASGTALQTSIHDQLAANKAAVSALDLHIGFANRLNSVLFTLLVVVVLFAWLLPKLPHAAGTVGAVVIAVLAVLVIGLVARTGEQGTRTAWNPDGSQDYSVNQ